MAVGRKPNYDEMNLEKIGVTSLSQGISVTPQLKTSRKHIYAAGDCSGRSLFTHAARDEGGIVLSNAIFHLPRKVDYTYISWCTYSDPELTSIGMNEKRARAAGIEYTVWTEIFSNNDRAITKNSTSGKIKMLLNKKDKPIGI